MMSKKDFIALADFIRDHNRQSPFNVGLPFDDNHLDVLSAFCRSRNSRFNWNRWIDYIYGRCGPNGGAIRKSKGEMTAAEANHQDSLNPHCGCRECCSDRGAL